MTENALAVYKIINSHYRKVVQKEELDDVYTFKGKLQDIDNDQVEHYILANRREELKMTQQQVAELAGIQLRQYQRLEGRAEQTLKMMFDNSMDLTISSKKLNLFGDREYVSQYRGENSYKWNPEDERLQFAWITVHIGKSAELSGKIYQWK